MITPDEIAVKADNAYKRFLALWIRGEDGAFFPLRVPANLNLVRGNVPATIKCVGDLREKAKERRGWGYTVHWKEVNSREFGKNARPGRITVDTLDDLLRLTGRAEEFKATCAVVQRIRTALPGLSDWIASNVRTLSGLADTIDGLIAVTEHFLQNPWPDCYARQFPVSVDTKFIERNHSVLRQWLDILLPASAIDVNETRFPNRFGLRDSQQHRAIRVLDHGLLQELGLPFDELSLPVRSLARLCVRNVTVIIVENRLNLFTLPCLPRTIGIEGEGRAVTRLERLKWLYDNRIVYWGDIDVDGFAILSSVRNLFPHTESVMMDRPTLELHKAHVIEGNGRTVSIRSNLNDGEAAAYQLCQKENMRLEQERILQSHADTMLHTMISIRPV